MTKTSQGNTLPSTMRAWSMTSAIGKDAKDLSDISKVKDGLVLQDSLPLPQLQDGQILVQMACGTLNHEDRLHLQNAYINSQNTPLPRSVGFEGAGKIVDTRKVPWYLGLKKGTRVAFYAGKAGCFSEYLAVDAMTVIPIPDKKDGDGRSPVSYSTAAAAVTNPITVVFMVDRIKRIGHSVVINTVGAGALGRLFTKYATSVGMDVICLVRRDAQAELCFQDGAKYVLNTAKTDFEQELKQVVKDTGCLYAYDGLGGSMPDLLLQALPNGSTVSIYSHIVSEDVTIDSRNLFHEKRLEAFNAADEAKALWTIQLLFIVSKLQKWMTVPEMQTTIRQQYGLEELPEAIVASATGNKSDGKVQVVVNPSLMEE